MTNDKSTLADIRSDAAAETLRASLIEQFEATVPLFADKIGLSDDTLKLTYAEINQRVNRIAHAILEHIHKGAEGISVALMFDHNAYAVMGVLAALKAHKAYMPLAPWQPRQRSQSILNAGQPCVLVTNDLHLTFARSMVEAMPQPIPIVNIDHLPDSLPDTNPVLGQPVDPDSLFSILHTSGSTGAPKAIARTHRAMMAGIGYRVELRTFSHEERTILFVSYTAGASRGTTLSTLLLGGTLHVYDMKRRGVTPVTGLMQELQITTISMMPTILRRWLSTMTGPVDLPHLRELRMAGEPVIRSDLERAIKFLPAHTKLTVSLVAGEIGAIARYEVDKDNLFEGETVPVGFAPANRKVRLLDEHDNPVPPGEVGEFVVTARNLSRAYIFDEALSERKYKPDPDDPSLLCYYTGDLGRLRPDGMYEFVGRKDSMVKVRGHQVVTNDLEDILREHPAIHEVAVKPTGISREDVRIAAYYTIEPDADPEDVSATALRKWLARRVPDYMLPSYYTRLDNLPLTDTGKINRPALPEPDRVRPEIDAQFTPPSTALQIQLVRIWEQVLGISPIGIDDGFFDLGGHSLLASQVVHEIDQQLGLKILMGALSQAPTVRRLTEILQDYQPEKALASIVPIKPGGSRLPLYCIHPRGGLVGLYYHLSRNLGADQPVYGLQAQGLDGISEPHRTIAEMAAHYISEIKSVQPEGPYHLAGFSLGGQIIHEMACQLEEQAERVGLVALLDSNAPRNTAGRLNAAIQMRLQAISTAVANLRRAISSTLHIVGTHPRQRWLPEIRAKRQQVLDARHEQAANRARIVDPFNQPEWTPERRVLWANRKAGSAHTPRVYRGAVTFFLASESKRLHQPPESFWGPLATGGVTVVDIPGTHRSIMEEPGVRILAERLIEALDAVNDLK